MQKEAPDKFTNDLTLSDKIYYVLRVLHKASADEVAMEIMELQGIASEEAVAELTDEVTDELVRLFETGIIVKVKDHRQKVRYALS